MHRTSISKHSISLVEWHNLSAKEQATVGGLSINQEQVEFAGSVDAAITLCKASDREELVGLAVLSKANVVGFLLLKRGSKAPKWVPSDAAVITALRIDIKYQGDGLGSEALTLLPIWVNKNWPSTRSLVLSVDEENLPAIKSYQKAGWRDNGVRIQGRIGWELHMTLQLADSYDDFSKLGNVQKST